MPKFTHTTFQLAFLFFQLQTKARVCPEAAGNSARKQNTRTEQKKKKKEKVSVLSHEFTLEPVFLYRQPNIVHYSKTFLKCMTSNF